MSLLLHSPSHLSHPHSQQHHHSARPLAHTPHCGNMSPHPHGRAVAGAQHSPPHLSHPGSHGHHRSAGPGPRTAHSDRKTQRDHTPSALWAKAKAEKMHCPYPLSRLSWAMPAPGPTRNLVHPPVRAGNPISPFHPAPGSYHSPAHRCGPGSRHGRHTASSWGCSGWQCRSARHTPAWVSSSQSHLSRRGTGAPHHSALPPQHTRLRSHSGKPLGRQGALHCLQKAARVPRPFASPPVT